MIPLSKINGEEFFLNSDLIETVQSTPDTVITLTTGKKLMVRESPEEILYRFIEFRRTIFLGLKIVRNSDLS